MAMANSKLEQIAKLVKEKHIPSAQSTVEKWIELIMSAIVSILLAQIVGVCVSEGT